jgi:beta-glucosidase
VEVKVIIKDFRMKKFMSPILQQKNIMLLALLCILLNAGSIKTQNGPAASPQTATTNHQWPATNPKPDIAADNTQMYWDWQHRNITEIKFPQDFLWGVATSAHQSEGNCTNNNWSDWEEKKNIEKSGNAIEHWDRYKEDIELIKDLGVNTYRFSIEWSKIEPEEGVLDVGALQHYIDVIDEVIRQGMKPCITLHHYTQPLWFEEMDGFEKEENIAYFVRFAATMMKHLKDKVHLFFTFNNPDGYAAKSFMVGINPPGKKNKQLMATVYKNMLEAHVRVYDEGKRIDASSRIGILKNMYLLDPWNPWNPLDILTCAMGTKLMDTCFFEYFTTGIFKIQIPFLVNISHTNLNARGKLDFIGINYYSHTYFKNFKRVKSPREELTDTDIYTVYPEGLYRATAQVSKELAQILKIPIYITENGIATNDTKKRDRFLKRTLYVLSQTIKDGFNVKGYIHWSAFDNYEWGSYTPKYGIYSINRETQERTCKIGSYYFIKVIQDWRNQYNLQVS